MIGFGSTRPRAFTWGHLRSSVVFHGSWSHFLEVFARRVVHTGAIFMVDDAGQDLLDHYAQLNFNFRRGQRSSIKDALTVPQQSIYDGYYQLKPQHQSACGTFFFDVEQNVSYGSYGQFFLTQVAHGKIVACRSGHEDRIATGKEHLFAVGECVFPELVDTDYECLFLSLLRSGVLTNANLKSLAGNSFHLPLIGAIMSYLLAMSERMPAEYQLMWAEVRLGLLEEQQSTAYISSSQESEDLIIEDLDELEQPD